MNNLLQSLAGSALLVTFCLLIGLSGQLSLSAESDFVIQTGDTLKITLKEDAEFSFRGAVDSEGRVNLPFFGEYPIAGVTLQSAKKQLQTTLEETFYKTATPEIAILESADAGIYVYGAVKEPGLVSFERARNLSFAQALAGVKGLTSWANIEKAYILRPNSTGTVERIDLNLREQLTQQDESATIRLLNRDELYILGANEGDANLLVSSDPREVVVVGQVNSPGVIKFAPGEEATLMRAVFKAGGLTRFARGDRIKLIRYSGENRVVELVNLEVVIEEGFLDKDRSLLPGDMVIVPQKFINL